jgi:tetratricopeptide (TPR) repeat protein
MSIDDPTFDETATPPNGGSAGFAQLVMALQAKPEPRPRRLRGASAGKAVQEAPVSLDERLDHAEACLLSGRLDEAIAICSTLRPRLATHGDAEQRGWCDFVLCQSHMNAGRAKESVVSGYRAITQLGHGTRLLRSLVVLACSVAHRGDAGGALALLERARRLLPEVAQSPRDRCLFWVNSGAAYHALGDLVQAIRHSTLAETLLDEFDDPYVHAVVRMNLPVQRLGLAVARCNGVETLELMELLAACGSRIDALVAAGQHFPVAKGSEDIADAYIAVGRHEQARAALLVGVRSADAAKAGPDRGILEVRLARLERLSGRYRSASAHISLALELLAEGELPKYLAEAHLENCLLHEERQHCRAALDSFRQYAQIRERLLVAQSDARAHALTMRFEHELERLRSER